MVLPSSPTSSNLTSISEISCTSKMKKRTEVNKENTEYTVACGKYSNFCTLKEKNKKIALFPLRCFYSTTLSLCVCNNYFSRVWNTMRLDRLVPSISLQDSRTMTEKTAQIWKFTLWIKSTNCILKLKLSHLPHFFVFSDHFIFKNWINPRLSFHFLLFDAKSREVRAGLRKIRRGWRRIHYVVGNGQRGDLLATKEVHGRKKHSVGIE